MQNSKIIALVAGILVIVIVIVGILIIQNNNSATNSTANSSSSSQTSSSSQDSIASADASQDNSIDIQDMMFTPETLIINKGDTVTWTNSDSVSHTVTSDTNAFDSGTMTNGKTFEFTFNQVGTFTYHCKFHPTMIGTIIVK